MQSSWTNWTNTFLLSLALLGSCLSMLAAATDVSYDSRAIIINGERRVIFSGAIHYPRSTPEVFYCFICLFICVFLICFSCIWSELHIYILVTDVARFDSKGKRRWHWCNWNVYILEPPWAPTWEGLVLILIQLKEINSIFKLNYFCFDLCCLVFAMACNQYHFSGNLNFVKFFKLVQKAGLHVVLRIGPYVCAEWNYG